MTDSPLKEPPPAVHEDELAAVDDAVIGRVFRRSLAVIVVLAAAVVLILVFVRRSGPSTPTVEADVQAPRRIESRPVTAVAPEVRFTDITVESGIDFVHENGAKGDKLLPETMGGGCAFLDYDNDGDQDIFLVNSDHWPGEAPPGLPPPTPALYRNDGAGRFENVTAGSGLDVHFYGMGVSVGDYDGDGLVDVFITAVGANRLFRNTGDGFEDVTRRAGVAGGASEWSTGAAFFDYDNDGDLDLFVCNYVRWSRETDFEVGFTLSGVGRAYGPPMQFEGTHPYFYRNNGDGTFEEAAASSGLQVNNPATDLPMAKSLAVMATDVDRDGWIDLFVANDTVRNFFFRNNGDGTFSEEAELTGLAYDRNGSATGAMGVDAGSFRNDDAVGFFIGNFANEMTSVYVSQGDASIFADEAIGEGIGGPSRLMLTFALFLFDYDLDGRLDLLQVNGHLEEEINTVQPSQHYKQSPQLFWNAGESVGGPGFLAVEPAKCGDLGTPIVGRGAAYADIDGDGDLDVLLTQVGGRPHLLRNDNASGNHWLRVKLVGESPNRHAIGATVEVVVGETVMRRQVMPARSYLSSVELPVTFGLGGASRVDTLRIVWPDGTESRFSDQAADRQYTIEQGKGIVSGIESGDAT